ncbi:MAG: hypothetical protein ABI692_00745 [Terracoccus sp.]
MVTQPQATDDAAADNAARFLRHPLVLDALGGGDLARTYSEVRPDKSTQ